MEQDKQQPTTDQFGYTSQSGDRAWIEDGVLYVMYGSTVAPSIVLEILDACVRMARQHNPQVLPLVCGFAPDVQFVDMPLSKASRMINNEFLKHINSVAIVKTRNALYNNIMKMTGKFFLNDRMRFFDTIEEAAEWAKPQRDTIRPILEP